MIVRSWRARSTKEKASRYVEHARAHVFPQLAGISGHRGALVLRRDGPAEVEIVVLTFWSSMQAVAAFAGANPDAAVVDPEAQALLLDYDQAVQHHDLVCARGLPMAP